MKLFKRKTTDEVTTEALAVPYPIETDEQKPSRNWLMLASLVIAALAFAVLIVLAGRWAYNRWNSTGAGSASSLPKPPPQDLKPDAAPVAP